MRNLAAELAVRGLLFANAPALFARLYHFEWYGGTLRRLRYMAVSMCRFYVPVQVYCAVMTLCESGSAVQGLGV